VSASEAQESLAATQARGSLAATEAIGLLRSGASPEQAWREAYGVGVEADGAPAVSRSDPSERALRAAGRLARQTGAPLADVLETIVETERARERAEVARELALAGPRASGLVLQWLPAAGWALAAAVDVTSLRILAGTPLGWLLLAIGSALWFAGRRWIRALTATAREAGRASEPAALPLALAEAAVAAGLDLRSAIAAVGLAIGEGPGAALASVAGSLGNGVAWDAAWADATWADAAPSIEPLGRALRSSWMSGASPLPLLRASREVVVERARAEAEGAAAVLGVRVALPLALCLLPAFVVVGVVPLLLAVARGAGLESMSP
jgi:tight adherence protein B